MPITTIQLKKELKNRLERYKLHASESYNEVIERILEDISRINEETRRGLQKARQEYREGKFKTHEQIKRELGFL